MKTANELAYEFPEQNLLNLEHDAVTKLNDWGIDAAAMLRSQAAEIEQLKKERDALRADAERQEAKIKALRKSLNWALSNFSEEPFEWSNEEDADAHKEAMAAVKETT